jgi:hypothetical protein
MGKSMQSYTFAGIALEDVKKMMAQWLSNHKVTVKKEYAPVEMRRPAGRFTRKGHGKVMFVSILLDYEDSN